MKNRKMSIPSSSSISPSDTNSRRNTILTVFAAMTLFTAFLLPQSAAAYYDFAGFGLVGLTGDPTEFSQYVSPNHQESFSTWTPGNYASPLSLPGSNGYSATAQATLNSVGSDLRVFSGSLTTQVADAELIYTVTSGTPTGVGGVYAAHGC